MRLRTELRGLWRAVEDHGQRSGQICAVIQGLGVWPPSPVNLMMFTALPGEPDLGDLLRWCSVRSDVVTTPEDNPDPRSLDLVILPGLGFTCDGARLGQGGGWYDRFLVQTRTDCVRIGVGFGVQIRDKIPQEGHDMAVHHVVTEDGRIGP